MAKKFPAVGGAIPSKEAAYRTEYTSSAADPQVTPKSA
jgi:hypothetical protein